MTALVSEIILSSPELFIPIYDYPFVLNTRYNLTGYSLADLSGNNHAVSLDGSFGFANPGNSSTQWPIPRSAHPGMPMAQWIGYSVPQILTDIGPGLWDVTAAWTVEHWYRRYQTTLGHTWYFGNADIYSPVTHQIYLAPSYIDLTGIRHKRALYTPNNSSVVGHHVVLVYDGSTTVTLYIDAVAVVSLAVNIAALNIQLNSAVRLMIGRNNRIVAGYISGSTEDTVSYFALYRHVLTPEQILRHYQVGSTLNTMPLNGIEPRKFKPFWLIRS